MQSREMLTGTVVDWDRQVLWQCERLNEGRVQIEQYRPHMREVSGYNVVYWKQKDMAYLMVSALDKEECKQLYLKVRRAL